MRAIFETAFDAVYLVTVVTLGIIMIKRSLSAEYSNEAEIGEFSRGKRQYLLFGIMAVTLGAGDAFHLVPRAAALCTTGLESYTAALGIGKLITSVTMTAFYVLLYYVWRSRYKVSGKSVITAQCGFARQFAPCFVSCRRISGQVPTRRFRGAFIGIFRLRCWAV